MLLLPSTQDIASFNSSRSAILVQSRSTISQARRVSSGMPARIAFLCACNAFAKGKSPHLTHCQPSTARLKLTACRLGHGRRCNPVFTRLQTLWTRREQKGQYSECLRKAERSFCRRAPLLQKWCLHFHQIVRAPAKTVAFRSRDVLER